LIETVKCRDEGGPAQAQGSAGANNSLLNISTLRPDRILSCTTQPARPPIPANWSPWLHSLPYVGYRRALPRSNVAATAREEVRSDSGPCKKTADKSIAFHPAPASLAAHNFSMPALSPTMTEGNIATWKIKEGTTDPLRYRASAPQTRSTGIHRHWLAYSWESSANLTRRILLRRRCSPRDRNRQGANGG
jgi:hypothetical protein